MTLLFAAVLRVWGLPFGLPNTAAHPDESLLANTSVRMLRGQLNPGFFNYPSLFAFAFPVFYYIVAGQGAPARSAQSYPYGTAIVIAS